MNMFWRGTVANALGASIAYAFVGAALEALRRWHPTHWAQLALRALDSIPARVLNHLGALPSLRELWLSGEVSGCVLRLLFATTTLAVIFILTFIVGGLTQWVFGRQA
jgi:hypothetical protein